MPWAGIGIGASVLFAAVAAVAAVGQWLWPRRPEREVGWALSKSLNETTKRPEWTLTNCGNRTAHDAKLEVSDGARLIGPDDPRDVPPGAAILFGAAMPFSRTRAFPILTVTWRHRPDEPDDEPQTWTSDLG